MTLPDEAVYQALHRFGNYKVEAAQRVALEGPADEISGFLLLALGLRESHLQNINNAAGTDRGCFQISDKYHSAWLKGQPGCPVGTGLASWRAVPGKTALDRGYCPRYTPALLFALDYLQAKRVRAKALGIPRDDRLEFAIASYNGGEGGALSGWREGNVDKYTTGRDYSAWVLAHRTVIHRVLKARMPNWIV